MKNVITLTKMLSLSVLLLIAGASTASTVTDGDKDTSKCKHECCKAKTAKEVKEAMKELKAVMKGLAVQVTAMDINVEVSEAVAVAPVKFVRKANRVIVSVEPACSKETEVKDQKINFTNLNKEMEQVQEDMTQMDSCLQKDDVKARKSAEELLKTGIKV